MQNASPADSATAINALTYWVAVGYFSITVGAVAAVYRLAKDEKITGAVLVVGMFVVATVLTLAVWKTEMPEGVLPVLGSIAGYAFGILTGDRLARTRIGQSRPDPV
jgi:uncharacterized membrane protein AbrB (regulator of aidB expression)